MVTSDLPIIELNKAPYRADYVHAETSSRFVVGVDLGQSADPTAVCVLEHRVEALNKWTVEDRWGEPDLKRQLSQTHFDVRHLERLPLNLSYPAIVGHVGMLLQRPPLSEGCELVVDETGVGRAVSDIFESHGLRPVRVAITAGNEATRVSHAPERWHVPKQTLISGLDARLHTGELRFAAELREAGAMAEELKDFRRHVSAAGRFSYDARAGRHDDLVLAVAIALWRATLPMRGLSVVRFVV